MKLTSIMLSFFLFCLAGALRAQNKEQDFIQVSQTYPRYFESVKGKTYIPVGLNICWPRFLEGEAEGLAKMEYYFKKLSDNGGNFVRIWLSAPFWEIEVNKAGAYEDLRMLRLEKLLSLAKKYHIRLKFTLENFRQLTGSPAPFPGSVPFDKPIYDFSNSGPLKSMADYLNSDTGRNLYINRAKKLSHLFANDPSVFAIELWNEMSSVKADGWKEWTSMMLDTIHRIFPRQLITQSLGSFSMEKQYSTYKEIVSLANNDIAQVHRYIDEGAELAISKAPMDQLASEAVTTLLGFTSSKPVLLAEVGAVQPHHTGPWKLYAKDTLGVVLHDLLFASFFSGGAAPGHSWHWDSYVEKNNLWYLFQRFNAAIKGFDPIKEKAQPFKGEQSGIRFYGLKGTRHILIWIRDANSDWKSELVKGVNPDLVQGQKLDLKNISVKSVKFYDPWENHWKDTRVSSSAISLPTFRRSLVVKIKIKE